MGKDRRSIEASEADVGARRGGGSRRRVSRSGRRRGHLCRSPHDASADRLRGNAVKDYRDTLALTKARKAGGLVADTEVVKAEASWRSAEAQTPPLQADVVRARHRLAVLTGGSPSELDELLEAGKPLPAFHGNVSAGIPRTCFVGVPT